MAAGNGNAPIIIKRKKVTGGDGHHGGAWKVAYADFVTAMMAFFMLMWLLNATTEKQRKGLADYFNPTIPVNRISGGGDGAFSGDSVFAEETLARNGTGASVAVPNISKAARGSSGQDAQAPDAGQERVVFEEIVDALMAFSGEAIFGDELRRHIVTRVTDEGLIIDIFDLPGEPLFLPGTREPTELMMDLSEVVAKVFALVPNQIAIGGHIRSRPVVLRDTAVWELSAGRADHTRRLLEQAGIGASRLARVTGYADRKLTVGDPLSVRNNRIEVILLRNDRGG